MLKSFIFSFLCVLSIGICFGSRPIVDINATSPMPYRNNAEQIVNGGFAEGTTNELSDVLSEEFVTRPKAVDSNCLTFSGAQYAFSEPITPATSSIRLRSYVYISAYPTGANFGAIIAGRSSASPTTGLWLAITNVGELQLFQGGVFATSENLGTPLNLSTWYEVDVLCDCSGGGNVTYKVTDLSNGTISTNTEAITVAPNFASGQDVYFGRLSSASAYFLTGAMAGVEITVDGTVVRSHSMCEGWGVYLADNTGNGNYATLINATLAVAWGATQDYFHPNLEHGFSLYEHATDPEIRVPFLTTVVPNPSPTVPAGYTLTKHVEGISTSGSVHNGAETFVVPTDTNLLTRAFWSADGTTFSYRSYSDITNYYATSNGDDGVYIRMYGDDISYITTYSTNWIESVPSGIIDLLDASYGR